jgi:hypothetical protein
MDPLFITGAVIGALAISLLFAILVGRMIALGDFDDDQAGRAVASPAAEDRPPTVVYPIAMARQRRHRQIDGAA